MRFSRWSATRVNYCHLGEIADSRDPVARLFGAAMAVRPRLFIDPAFVAIAATIKDAEVLKLVRDATDAALPPWAVCMGSSPTRIEDDVGIWGAAVTVQGAGVRA